MIEAVLFRCVAAWCPGATGVTAAAKLSGGASQETWTFDIVHPDGNIGAILRHSSIETTQIYAKVDVPSLKQIAQPWPEV